MIKLCKHREIFMVCPATTLNLFHPVSLIGMGYLTYSIFNIFTGVTYIKSSYQLFPHPLYRDENPKVFAFAVSVNIIVSLFLIDIINNFGLIRFFKFLFGIN